MQFDSLEDLKDSFALFDDWEERYRFLIDLGRILPDMPEELKTDGALVKGCTSRVWMIPQEKADEDGDIRFHFLADSDAQIVRGLIAILYVAYNNQPVNEIKAIDIEAFFQDISLDKHLSPNRRNGFFSIADDIRSRYA
jgi:cysteine desulfuration protein SufE